MKTAHAAQHTAAQTVVLPEVAGPVMAMGEGVVLQAEEAHVVGEVQLHPGGRVGALAGGEPAICPLLPAAQHHVPGPAL